MSQDSYTGWASPRRPHAVALLVDEGSNPFEMSCAIEVFGARRREQLGFEPYRTWIASPVRSVPMRDNLFTLGGGEDIASLDHADTIVVPNRPDVESGCRRSVLAAIRRAHRRGARLIGLCTGAYTLAEAGVLAGRHAAVHWQLAEDFARRHPEVQVEPDVLFVDDDDVLTSAGSSAALDLALHVVRKDWGAEVANHVSRRLVFSTFRDGGQTQFVERPLPGATTVPLAALLQWATERLDQPLGVRELSLHANVGATTLHRRFRDELGTTPLKWLTMQRVQHCCRLLETTDLPLDGIARLSGFGTSANLRKVMKTHTGLSPSAYRRQFAAG